MLTWVSLAFPNRVYLQPFGTIRFGDLDVETVFERIWLSRYFYWEGFANRKAAESYIGKIIELVTEDEPLYRWPSGYLRATNLDETA